ncbi:MAG TPA: hypothetical protein VIW27_00145 [Gammaproteobacteria bacterium]|jgi:hypothetical protein
MQQAFRHGRRAIARQRKSPDNRRIRAAAAAAARYNQRHQTGDLALRPPEKECPKPSVTYSLLISESVYKLVVAIERLIRWFCKAVLPGCKRFYWCLRW